ncbi:MAG TPA: ATP-binding cassette domain-containing protein [Cyclobacteriaceae bacterium]|nr:ATP-binding cassette domain-containing protein [Cyclobacteriaceae bacterium]
MNILSIHNTSKRFGDHLALRNVNLEIPGQSIVGLLGPNGAGKTTLIRIITQIIMADEGEVQIKGKKISLDDIIRIGYLPEERGLYKKMQVGEQLLYLAELKGLRKKIAKEKLRIWLKKFNALEWWNKKVEDLSKGMQQKIQFIATVIHEPELIILDEPFSGFDPINASLIRDELLEIRKNGATILFSTHRMETVEELCDYIALIHKAEKILEGPKNRIKESYRSNTYIVDHKRILSSNGRPYQILSQVPLEIPDHFRTTIRLNPNMSTNQLISELIRHVEIVSFQEKVPTMHDIFINAVTGKVHE